MLQCAALKSQREKKKERKYTLAIIILIAVIYWALIPGTTLAFVYSININRKGNIGQHS